MIENGIMRAAILMLTLGEDEAVEVMKYLGPKEVQKLGTAMASLKSVGNDDVESVLESFLKAVDESATFGLDSEEYIHSVLTKALGDDNASGLLSRIMQGRDASGIESLKWMDVQAVVEFIKNEHPQIIATILVHLEADQSAEVMGQFSERLRQDVMLRIATLDGVKPAALKELNEVLTKLLSGNENLKKKSIGGIKSAANIMNFMSGESEANLIEGLKNYDSVMAQKIMDEMFVFDNILDIDDKGIQTILKEVQSDSLIVALKGTSAELREKIYSNMSTRASEMLKEDLENKGPVRLSEVEAQQKIILQTIRRLAEEGQVVLGSKSEDAYV